MKIIFCTNLPSPYRVDFFNELGKFCELTVCYEREKATDRDAKWVCDKAINYEEVYLKLIPVGTDKSRGTALKEYILSHPCDRLILTNYSSPACIVAINACRIHRIPFWIEYDGGFYKVDSYFKRSLKKYLISKAEGHLTTCEEHIMYLQSLGINRDIIFKYPFTSVSDNDIQRATHMRRIDKTQYRKKLLMNEDKIVISVGQFIHRKGMDLVISAAKMMNDIGIYIIGGEPTYEYRKQAEGCNNVHFVSFKTKEELKEYYCAADAMLFLTREDIWGLVVNEAMTFGLPVITTDHCMAGVEMINDGENGFLVPADTYLEAVQCIKNLFDTKTQIITMSQKCIETAKKYTISQMVLRHMEIFNSL